MICKAVTENGEEVILDNILSICLNQDVLVPADDIIIVAANKENEVFAFIELIDDEQTVFSGIVDEQTQIFEADGEIVKIIARSFAALLLDNEALPVQYNCPDDKVIYENHIKPFLNTLNFQDGSYSGVLQAKKGVSHWKIIEEYCLNTYNAYPRVNEDAQVILNGKISDKKLVFSNSSKDNRLPYKFLSLTKRRCNQISSVFVRCEDGKGYNLEIENDKVKDKNILRQRFLNVVDTQDATIYHADKMIESSNIGNFEIKLVAPGRILKSLSAAVNIDDSKYYSKQENLTVIRIKYTLGANGEETTLWLSPC